MSLHASPSGVDPDEIGAFLRSRPGVARMHDLHIWPLSTTETALTAHLLIPGGYPGDGYTVKLAVELRERFGIDHATIQIEIDPGTPCGLEPANVV